MVFKSKNPSSEPKKPSNHNSGSMLSLAFAEFDKGIKPSYLHRRTRKFKEVGYATLMTYHNMWKNEGGKKKLDTIITIKEILRKKVEAGLDKKEEAAIPKVIKVLESKPYSWFAEKSIIQSLNAAADEVNDYPKCLRGSDVDISVKEDYEENKVNVEEEVQEAYDKGRKQGYKAGQDKLKSDTMHDVANAREEGFCNAIKAVLIADSAFKVFYKGNENIEIDELVNDKSIRKYRNIYNCLTLLNKNGFMHDTLKEIVQ